MARNGIEEVLDEIEGIQIELARLTRAMKSLSDIPDTPQAQDTIMKTFARVQDRLGQLYVDLHGEATGTTGLQFKETTFDHPDRRRLSKSLHDLNTAVYEPPETMRIQITVRRGDILMAAALFRAYKGKKADRGDLTWASEPLDLAENGEWDHLRREARLQIAWMVTLLFDQEQSELATGSHHLFWDDPSDEAGDEDDRADEIPY